MSSVRPVGFDQTKEVLEHISGCNLASVLEELEDERRGVRPSPIREGEGKLALSDLRWTLKCIVYVNLQRAFNQRQTIPEKSESPVRPVFSSARMPQSLKGHTRVSMLEESAAVL